MIAGILIDGHPATPDDLACQAMVNYGAYTSFSKQPAVSRNNLLTRTVNLALQSEPTRYLTSV